MSVLLLSSSTLVVEPVSTFNCVAETCVLLSSAYHAQFLLFIRLASMIIFGGLMGSHWGLGSRSGPTCTTLRTGQGNELARTCLDTVGIHTCCFLLNTWIDVNPITPKQDLIGV